MRRLVLRGISFDLLAAQAQAQAQAQAKAYVDAFTACLTVGGLM
jgi:hypothetical protein